MSLLLMIALVATFLSDRRSLSQFENSLIIIGVKRSEIRRYVMFFGLPRYILLSIPLLVYTPGMSLSVLIMFILLFVLYIMSVLSVKG